MVEKIKLKKISYIVKMEGYIGHTFYLKNVCTDFYQNSFRSTFYTAILIALEYCLIPKSRLLIVNMGSLKTLLVSRVTLSDRTEIYIVSSSFI